MIVLGVGGRAGATGETLLDLAGKACAEAGLALSDVGTVTTLDRRADHPGVRRLLAATGARLRSWPAQVLAGQPVSRPSDTVAGHVGTPSVAEASVRAGGATPLGPARSAHGWVVVLGRAEPDLLHHGDTEVEPGMVDFAVNVHASEPPAFLRAALTEAIGDLARYPDPRAAQAAVARAHGVPVECVLLTHGAAEAFTLIAQQDWAAPTVVHPQFTEPEAALRAAGHLPDRLILTEEDDFRLTSTPDARADLVVVGNPTNPTSRLHRADEIDTLRAPGRVLVVDEAFLDVVEPVDAPVDSRASAAAANPDLVVVRSLTKTFSLAGLRVGYVVAHPDRIAALTTRRTPWPVSTMAAAAAIACMSHEGRAYAARVRAEVPPRLAHLGEGLRQLGFTVVPEPRAPFLLARRADAVDVRTSLRSKGIAVRRGDTFPGLDATWLRFAAREEHAVGVLLAALRVATEVTTPREV
jgi:histidinol-phosphate aminotransferase